MTAKWSGFYVPQRTAYGNLNHLLTLTAPTREQVLTVLACILQREACRSQGGALLSTDGTSDSRKRGVEQV